MTCQRALSLIEVFLDGELSPEEVEQLNRHLDSCSECREELHAAQRLKQLLRQMPRYNPGRDYWSETARLIRARTADVPMNDWQVPVARTSAVGERRNALVRALVSLAASLFILFSTIFIGTSQDNRVARMTTSDVPILATAPVSELLGVDNSPMVTRSEQIQLAKGMLLMGAPGFLGRFAGIPDLMVTAE